MKINKYVRQYLIFCEKYLFSVSINENGKKKKTKEG